MNDNFNFFVNYECTSATDHFFRNVGQPFLFTVTPVVLSAGVTYWVTLNQDDTIYNISDTLTFINTQSSIQTITLHCSSPQVDIAKSVSAVFLDPIPIVDYISWPMYYMPDSSRVIKLSSSNYILSQSLSFYGEGHVDKVTFQAVTPSDGQYTWLVNGSSTLSTSLTSASITISSTPGVSSILPVECKLVDPLRYITSNSPSYFYDDQTGERTPYPYYYNTNNNKNNNKYKQSVYIKTYPIPSNALTHNAKAPILLNSGQVYPCNFSFQYAPRENFLDECFGKYGEVWKWSTFTESDSALPCTWTSLKTNVLNNTRLFYNKKWYKENFDSVSYVRSPIVQTLSTLRWHVDSLSWRFDYPSTNTDFSMVPASSFKSFSIPLSSYSNNLDQLYVVSDNYNTTLIVTMSAQFVSKMVEYIDIVYDWKPRLQTLQHTVSTYVYPMPNVLLYTANKYVLKSQ